MEFVNASISDNSYNSTNLLNQSTRITYIDPGIIHQSTMPSNRTFHDVDFVLPT